MEYISRCGCGKHNIIKTVKQITLNPTKRLPQRVSNCNTCKKDKRMTIIGEIVKTATNANPDAEYATANRLVIHFFKPL